MKKQLIFVFLIMLISASQAFAHQEDCEVYSGTISGYSEVFLFADEVYGLAQTEIDFTVSNPPFYCYDYEFYADIESELLGPNVDSPQTQSGKPDSTMVQIEYESVEAEPGTYCVTSNHQYGGSYTWNNHNEEDEIIILDGDGFNYQTNQCLTIEEPTPTPTPCFGNNCQTPTPTPTPSVSITPIEVVEKYGKKNLKVTVENNANGSTKFKLTKTAGTGSATFDDGSTEITVSGNLTNHLLPIKGVTESDRLDNIKIEARLNNNTNVSAQDDFTVAYITEMSFEQINSDDVVIDANPGNGRTSANTAIGRRIFPDRTTPTNTTDRSIIRISAQVLPEVAGIKVYFASYDLDDPSADGLPIDPTDTTATPRGGNDNNGAVNVSTSGELQKKSQSDASCSGESIANNISFIQCITASKGAKANYKVTMQPGDNFAVFATVDDEYRGKIKVNPQAGVDLVNDANQTIHISGQTNPNNVAGIRTDMLTVWRKLHIEADSMGTVPSNITDPNVNRVEGTITGLYQTTCPNPPGTCTVNTFYSVNVQLDEHRFQGGHIRIGARSFNVLDNGIQQILNSQIVVLNGNPQGANTIRRGSQFTIYDDDDFNDSDGTTLDGDTNENIDPPPHSLVENTDTPCPDSLTATNCNIFASSYTKPFYDLTGNSETPFSLNVNVSTVTANPAPTEIQAYFQFADSNTEADPNFWTIYLNGAYQYDVRRDGDGDQPINGQNLSPVLGTVDAINGQGALIFMESTRPHELGNTGTRRVTRDFTVAHELGHLFYGLHGDGGLMSQSTTRTIGIFSDTSVNKIRGGEFTDPTGTTRRITNP